VEVLVSGDADLLDAGLSDLTVLRPSELMDRLAAVLGAEGEAMVAAREALQETREGWAGVLALLGGYGYRPKLTSGVLVVYRGDGSTVTIKSDEGRLGHRYDDRELRATLRAADRSVVETASLELRESEEIVEVVLELLTRQEEGSARTDAFIRHFPPESNLARMTLTAAYVRYRPHLDALAERGVHAYLEAVQGAMRIFSDLSPTLLLDISIADAGVPVFDDADGAWVVFLDTPDGYEAEFTVDRYTDPDDDADNLADAIADALSHVLIGGHIFMQHYDPDFGRLDPSWLPGRGS
jgi:hypothetical protein